jgi:type IV pilus assembly protein PilP
MFMRISNSRHWILGGTALLLASCASNDMSDLQAYTDEIKAQKNIVLTPPPDFPKEEIYIYPHKPTDRSPFDLIDDVKQNSRDVALDIDDPNKQKRVDCIPPDRHRNKEPLEQFPLDALKMVGTLAQGGSFWGLIQDPDGLLYQVQINNYLGSNSGKIINIGDDKIEVMELVEEGSGTGCYILRSNSIATKVER